MMSCYDARLLESFPPQARIKKIMQLDNDVGRVASSVPVVICILMVCMCLVPLRTLWLVWSQDFSLGGSI